MDHKAGDVLAKLYGQDTVSHGLWFHCPGCGRGHRVMTKEYNDGPTQWEWNGDLVKPTFSPSILTWWTEGEEKKDCRCHSFVTDGMIQFLSDCTHALAGQTVPLQPWDD